MKLKEFVNNLNQLMKDRPETAELQVVSAVDDEGNDFTPIYYTPSVGNYDADSRDFSEEVNGNAVCIN